MKKKFKFKRIPKIETPLQTKKREEKEKKKREKKRKKRARDETYKIK